MNDQEEKYNILLIDDEVQTVDSWKRNLERKGHTVLTANDGASGLKTLEQHSIDIVFCDIVMPIMDGINFLKHAHKKHNKAKIIMITGHSTFNRCIESIQYGASEYLIKPITFKDLLNSISRAKDTPSS